MAKKYGIKNASVTIFNNNTGEKVLECNPLTNDEICNSEMDYKSNLIPLRMQFNNNFEATIYVDEETLQKFNKLDKKQSK